MAKTEHVELIKQGSDVWNRWREDNPKDVPDLSGAMLWYQSLGAMNLIGANLREVNLRHATLSNTKLRGSDLSGSSLEESKVTDADFCSANLRGANLQKADLRRVDFSLADLTQANLKEASLSGIDFFGANLQGVDLIYSNILGTEIREANLSEANLNNATIYRSSFLGTDLIKADFTDASVGLTAFGDVDLNEAKGLDTIDHTEPSYVDIHTIYQVKFKISDVFLRGTGVPENIITYITSLAAQPSRFYTCFISYSAEDQAFAERIYADLQYKGVSCWFAPESMRIGSRIRQTLDQSIRSHDKLLIVLSWNSISSEWVEKEVETAFEEERKRKNTVLFPVRIDSAVMDTEQAWAADIRRTRHIGDFRNWKDYDAYREAFNRLLKDLKSTT